MHPDHLVWLYAVVDGRARPGLARARRLPDGTRPVRALPIDPFLTAIVADVPAAQFDRTAIEARLTDADWVAKVAAAHHAVIERMSRGRAVAPCRIFTLFESDDRVKAALAPMRAPLRTAIERVRGRAEWVVRVFRPARLRATAPKKAIVTGTDFLRGRRDDQRAEAEQKRAVAEDATQLAHALSSSADDHVLRPIEPGTSALVDAAYLVRTPLVSAFRRALSARSRELRDRGCRVTLTGPWPPYSFVTVGDTPRG